jgi:GNAT superfamily N-acetyltransferase
MLATATLIPPRDTLPLRVHHRVEMNCQIVHDSIHRRPGWTRTYALHAGDDTAGFGSVAIGGPWTDKPTIFEFYLLPPHRRHAFALFEALLEVSGARLMEVQSNDSLLAAMLHTYVPQVSSEAIVFHDGLTTTLPPNGATLEQVTPDEETRAAISQRQGGTQWRLHFGGQPIASGGVLFHYNEPYGDVYADVEEPFRGRGHGAYLFQELKRIAYELGSIPGARCSTGNLRSRKALQKAGFVPFAHLLNGTVAR